MNKRHYRQILIPLIALFLYGIVILMERSGVRVNYTDANIDLGQIEFTAPIQSKKECLILSAPEDGSDWVFLDLSTAVLDGMKVPYDVMNASDPASYAQLNNYQTVILTFEDWSYIGDNLLPLFEWVRNGGRLMNTTTPLPNSYFQTVSSKCGIDSTVLEYSSICGFQFKQDGIIGAPPGQLFPYTEYMDISLSVVLNENCDVWMTSEDGSIPLLWSTEYGKGRVVITNENIMDKFQRGFVCLSYSLLNDVCIYPVIDSSTFYLDDFPSPVPGGNGEYIQRDFGVDISDFYSSIWWPLVLKWTEDFGIRYTGVVIEDYSDIVKAPFPRNEDNIQFKKFGNMLLNSGGEIGFHGYNHMPLCLEGVDDRLQYGDYKLWKSKDSMKAAMTELNDFCCNLFPRATFSVYVPPSNILSDTGRQALLEACPSIKIISSFYIPQELSLSSEDTDLGQEYIQEFDVAEDGIINTPRIVSGLHLDSYQMICAMSELNFHYVQSHFMHPDDLLDEDRGAAEGWKALSASFEEYLTWMNESAPDLRQQTGIEMGEAVLKYDHLSVQREWQDQVLTVHLGGFSDEAHFLMRINDGTYQKAEGCTCKQITGNLYEVYTTQDTFQIYFE